MRIWFKQRKSRLTPPPQAAAPSFRSELEAPANARPDGSRARQGPDHRRQLKPGSQLPTENEIAEHLGISRTPVREAIKIFEAMGVLDVRIGSGTFVNQEIEPSLAQLLLFQLYLQKTTPQKMMEVRQMIARGCSEMAAQRRTTEDLAAMEAAIKKMEALAKLADPSFDEALEVDLEFHRAVNRAAHNELVETIGNFILDTVAPWIKISLQRLSPSAAVKVHRLEYEMIAAGNSDGARENKTMAAVDLSLENWRNSLDRNARRRPP